MPKIKLTVEYNGTGYYGWQVQPELPTVQGELQRVVELVLRQKVPMIEASGRTDTGVHARGQVVCVTVETLPDLGAFRRSISALLPRQVTVLTAEEVAEDFDPCRQAKLKQYSYHILHRDVPAVLDYGRVWHIPWHLDRERLKADAQVLIGEHDFTSFRATGCEAKTSVREILQSEVLVDGDQIIYRVVGRGFLKQMVRNIVGTLTDLAAGRLKNITIGEVLALQDRRRAGVTAPAHGLYLDWVSYAE